MSWTYTGNPGSSAKDLVRFLIGDTNQCDQLLQDAEITYILSLYNNAANNAAIRCCETIMSKFSRMADENVGQVKISFSQKAKSYRTMLRDLRNRLAKEDMVPYAGGISQSDEQAVRLNNNRIRPDFTKHMMTDWQWSPWVSNTLGINAYLGQGD